MGDGRVESKVYYGVKQKGREGCWLAGQRAVLRGDSEAARQARDGAGGRPPCFRCSSRVHSEKKLRKLRKQKQKKKDQKKEEDDQKKRVGQR
ncbi:hypothetical protein TESG_08509 [Trichophyton tonsurans CBS 112818]|uniref:Uncharacterized protein n=1 Tax=Trichophyton tonsurans (strain CBS 112818) TaxID=647933 RepID=F2S2K6_TRIT1|nr:hypothetical protein TESG_08509 [Trichophyton tonsurans CBS 112818]